MKYDTYTDKELARQPLGTAIIKIMHGSCPACTAKIQCQIGRAKHKITYCESCGQKIIWEVQNDKQKESCTNL